MPFLQRVIEPVHVCRNTLPLDQNGSLAVQVPNELECVTNGTLANIIRQLSSLSKHADDLFGNLFRESSSIVARANILQGRIDRLAIKVTQLDSTIEEVSLQDIHMRKAFKSYVVFEQQVVSRESMPAAIREVYLKCDKPPPLDKLNPYREDGKDGLKFYTDPNYFFDLWKQEMLRDMKENEKLLHDRGKKMIHAKEGTESHNQRVKLDYKKHKRSRQSHATKDKYGQHMMPKDESVGGFYPMQYGGAVPRISNHIQVEAQPIRPNSLDVHTNYFNRNQAPFNDGNKPQYPPPPPAYTEHPISPQQHYPPPPYVANTPERQMLSPCTTPTRTISRVNSTTRPSQPPPAPPALSSASSSGSSTPTVSVGTPSSSGSRYNRPQQKRDNLPPPPPPPVSLDARSKTSKDSSRNNSDASVPTSPLSPNKRVEPESKPIAELKKQASTSSSGTEVSTEKMVEQEPENDLEPELPVPPPIPTAEENDSENAKSSPVHQPPPPPPPPLPPLEDLGLDLAVDMTDNGSLSEHQNIEVVSITSESASETSSVSKLSEQQFNDKTKGFKDGRSDLLQAIREGIKLRRVEDHKQKEVAKAAPLHDVASILARRVALEFSDSDSPSGSECDSDGWEDENESTKA